MKRVLALVLAAMLLINLGGCMYGGGYRGHGGGESERRGGGDGGDHERRGGGERDGGHDRRH